MTFIHPPTVGRLVIGGAVTLFDGWLYYRHWIYEQFADLRLHSANDLLILEKGGFATLKRDSAGRIVGVVDTGLGPHCTRGLNEALRALADCPEVYADPAD